MNFRNGEDVFDHRIKVVSHYADRLYQSTRQLPWSQSSIAVRYLEDLRNALEELHVAEEELREQNEELVTAHAAIVMERQRYQELFEFAPDSYLITDPYGRIQEVNRAAVTLFNIPKQYLIGKLLITLVPEESRQSFRSLLNQIPTLQRVQEWEMRFRSKPSDRFEAAITVEVVRDAEGRMISLRWLLRDITARKQAEARLHQTQLQNLQLMEADRLKTQFIATISHELRTPMNAILGFSELLIRRFHHQIDPSMMVMVERIFTNGKHLLALIEEMLDFSRLQARCLELHLECFDLVDLAKTTLQDLFPLAEQKFLELKLNVSQSQMWVVNDQSRVRQVLINLISNGIKFTEQGCVTLELWSMPEDRVAIIVRDTGIGIDPIHQHHVFQEFWQANQSTTRQHGGAGLGLAIVQSLVDLMQGAVTVESQPGQGSTFRVEIPRQLAV